MNRWRQVRILLVFLLLGAIVNVALAWGCVIHTTRTAHKALRTPIKPFTIIGGGGSNNSWLRRELSVFEDRFSGFPVRSLAANLLEFDDEGRFGPSRSTWQRGLTVPMPQSLMYTDAVDLPIRPVWPGFAINTIFYAAILWFLFAAPFAVRRRRRIKRGLCPACAYPVGTSDVCTECGKPVIGKA